MQQSEFQVNIVKDGNKIPTTVRTKPSQAMKVQILSKKEGATILVANIECKEEAGYLVIEMTKYDDEHIGKKRGVETWKLKK